MNIIELTGVENSFEEILLMLYSILVSYNLYRLVICNRYRIIFYIIYAVVIIAEIML